MRFLLTSAGIKNTSIHNALVDLLGKPIGESSALCIPTGLQPFPGGPLHIYRFISGSAPSPMCELQEVGQSGLPHPVAQIQGTAAPNQQSVSLLDLRNPMLFFDAGQSSQLQHSQRLPTQLCSSAAGLRRFDPGTLHLTRWRSPVRSQHARKVL